uniref:Uncharacterized protein n=1 Tax=Arundo donax TaxID=35708 RepID=A0A0A9FT32_ARUDO
MPNPTRPMPIFLISLIS